MDILQKFLRTTAGLLRGFLTIIPNIPFCSNINGVDYGLSMEKEMVTHSSILAGKIPWTERPDGLQSMGLQRVGQA